MITLFEMKNFFPQFIFHKTEPLQRKASNKTARTLVYFIILALVPYLVPGLEKYQVLMPNTIAKYLQPKTNHQSDNQNALVRNVDGANSANNANNIDKQLTGQKLLANSDSSNVQALVSTTSTVSTVSTVSTTSTVTTPTNAIATATQEPFIDTEEQQIKPGEVEDVTGKALEPFFAKLLETETQGGQVKISHYGDSPITNDGITSTIRRNLQDKFGDAGHGYVLIDKPWGWYQHNGVELKPSAGWTNNPIFISRGDKFYGFGGVSFTTKAAGVTTSISTVAEGKSTHEVSYFDIYYLAQANGGDINIEVDGNLYSRLSTASLDGQTYSSFYQVPVSKGQHKLTLKTIGNGEVRLFGVVLGNDSSGVQYDSLGVNGAYIGLLANYINGEHWTEQLRYRNPNLVIIGYGANESQFEGLSMVQYEKDTKEVIRRIREALPGVAIMLVAPMDRGARGAGGGIVTRPMIPKLVSYQRKIATEMGCAFFDTFTAMGGDGTVAKWYEMRPKLMGGDFTHPTAQGSEIVGNLISKAILSAYEQYKNNQLAKHNVGNDKVSLNK